jgi:hypothetical protein
MQKNKNKKAQVNKVFVYASSLIVVGMIVYLAMKFLTGFVDTTENKIDLDFLNNLQTSYTKCSKTYSSEFKKEFRTTSKIEQICFMPKNNEECITKTEIGNKNIKNYDKTSLQTIIKNDNIILYDSNDIIYSKNIGHFKVDNCFCIKPKNNRINLYFENIDSNVKISNFDKLISTN